MKDREDIEYPSWGCIIGALAAVGVIGYFAIKLLIFCLKGLFNTLG